MSNQYFSIQQLRFQLGFSSKQKGYELQTRISRLYHQQLHALVQNFFYKTVPETVCIRKDSLLLDLGKLSYNELETELPKRLEKTLAEQFSVLLKNDKNGPSVGEGFESVPTASGYEYLLEFFLTTGTLPWQASLHPQLTWQVMLQELYKQDRNTLGSLLYKIGRQQAVRLRLAFQSTDADLQQLITAVEPVEAPFVLTYKKNIEAIQQQKQLVRSDASGFRQAVAYFILTYLLEEKESLFSKKTFIKSVLHQMAAHYNISFAGLLQVLYEALPAEIPAVSASGSLFAFVQALYLESGEGSEPPSLNGNKERHLSADAGPLALLEYFLVTGQLPEKATGNGVITWQAVLDELYERDRSPLNNLLRRVGRAYVVRKRMAYQLSEEALEKVFGVIEPVETPFIITYKKNIVEVQYDKQLVMAAGTDLRRAVSFFMLTYLLEEKESVFSKRMFIKSVLRQMADHYNVSYADLLTVLYEAMPERKAVGQQHESVFKTIHDIYQEEQFDRVTASGTFSSYRLRSIPDVLHYFLQYGIMPWWAKEQAGQSPETLLRQLYTRSVSAVLEILKKAGTEERAKQRFIWQFPEPLLYQVFSHLPEWDKAMAIVEWTIQLIEVMPALGHITQQSLKYALLDAVWSSYIKQGYHVFDEPHFYTRMFEHLAYLTSKSKEQIVHLLGEVISREKADEALIHFGQALYFTGTAANPSKADRIPQVIKLLEYYLTWNRFPDGVFTDDSQEPGKRLEAMLLLLYHENREALQRILQSDKHSVTARMHLHQLFTGSKGGDHKQVSLLLEAYLEKDALQYIKEMTGDTSIANEAGLKQALGHLLEKAKAGMGEGRSASGNLLRELLHKLKIGINWSVADAPLIQLIRQQLERQLQQQEEQEALKKKKDTAVQAPAAQPLQRPLQGSQKQLEQEQQAAHQKQPPPIEKAEKLYVTNAGLVLLHPFLSTYFSRLNLMEKGQFVNPEAQARAVHLLQYLVYNSTEQPEHELVLNKILCNYPLHEPLPLEFTPEQHEIDLTAELLQVVIQRSGKLSNSTVDGFRVSFLHREGALTETDEAWTLRVEQRGYDMILQLLPWSFGMIRFSWMDKPVYVEWM